MRHYALCFIPYSIAKPRWPKTYRGLLSRNTDLILERYFRAGSSLTAVSGDKNSVSLGGSVRKSLRSRSECGFFTVGRASSADVRTAIGLRPPFEIATMKRQRVLQTLAELEPILAERFGVTRLALFGSTVGDEASADNSDVDIIVVFNGPATSRRYFGVQFYLEDELGRSVDLVTEKALRPELCPYM